MFEKQFPKKFLPIYIECTTLGEAWVRLMWNCFEYGRPYFIEEGSRAGQHRLTMDFACATIIHPESRPFVPLAKPGQIVPTDEKTIEEQYFPRYVYSPLPPEPDEHYNYSEFLYPLANSIIKYYSEKSLWNAHPVMRVGDPFCFMDYFEPYDSECKRKTTPCLLGINPKIINIDKQLFMTFHVMYRSWDLFSGYLTNNGGFQLLKEFMCSEISERANIDLKPGPTVTSCVDLHLYEEDIVAASTWTNHNIENLLSFLKECRNKKTEDLYKLKNLLN